MDDGRTGVVLVSASVSVPVVKTTFEKTRRQPDTELLEQLAKSHPFLRYLVRNIVDVRSEQPVSTSVSRSLPGLYVTKQELGNERKNRVNRKIDNSVPQGLSTTYS